MNNPLHEGLPDDDSLVPDAVRELKIEDADLLSCNVATFERLFSPATMTASIALQLRGSVVLTSALCDRDPRPNWKIPEWRRYLNALFSKLPHFSYFLLALEQTYVGVVLSLLPLDALVIAEDRTVNYDRGALIAKLVSLLGPAAEYCRTIDDDPGPVLRNLLKGFTSDIAQDSLRQLDAF